MTDPSFTAQQLRDEASWVESLSTQDMSEQDQAELVAMLEFAARLVERTTPCRYCPHTKEAHPEGIECGLCECQQFSEEPR